MLKISTSTFTFLLYKTTLRRRRKEMRISGDQRYIPYKKSFIWEFEEKATSAFVYLIREGSRYQIG